MMASMSVEITMAVQARSAFESLLPKPREPGNIGHRRRDILEFSATVDCSHSETYTCRASTLFLSNIAILILTRP